MARRAAAERGWTTAAAVARSGRQIADHLRRVSPRRLGQFAKQVRLAWECVADWQGGRYRRMPWATVGSLAAALAYFVLPLDVIPDWIPGSGFLDDAALLAFVLQSTEADLRRYCNWRGLDPADYFAA
jgi:uncharacterized membrane protein YkvA (DUF1232 family)